MSHPTAISPEEQEQIARQIGVLLLQGAPEDWQQITVEYRATGEYHDLLAEAVRQDGSAESWEPPEELLGIFEHLREGMYRPDVGTWLSALYIVERPSSYRIDINFDEEPQWQQPLPRAAYVDELRRYPRSDDNIPDWMRDKLDGSSGTPQSQTGPAEPMPADQASPPPGEPSFEGTSPIAEPVPGDRDEDGTGPLPRAFGSSSAHFRTARVFDDADEQGRPLITTRLPIPPEDSAALRQYLENAPVVAAQGNELDQLDPSQAAVVPGTWHTDGVWLWQGAVAYYLAQYGVPPEPELVEHARSRRFGIAEIDDGTKDAAAGVLLAPSGVDADELDEVAHAPAPESPADPVGVADIEEAAAPNSDLTTDFAGDDREPRAQSQDTDTADQSVVGLSGLAAAPGLDTPAEDLQPAPTPPVETPRVETDSDGYAVEDDGIDLPPSTLGAPDLPAAEESAAGPIDGLDDEIGEEPEPEPADPTLDAPALDGPAQDDELPVAARHGRSDDDDEIDSADSEVIFDDLRARLEALDVDPDSYVIGERGESAWSLHDEGSDWVVAGPRAAPGEPMRFERPEQAAAFLLGSMLMTGDIAPATAPEDSAPQQPAEPEPAPVESGATDDDTTPQRGAAVDAPDQPGRRDSGGPAMADLPRRTPEPTPPEAGGNFLFTANETRERQAAEADASPTGQAPGEPAPDERAPGERTPDDNRPESQAPAAPPPPVGQPTQAPPPAAPGPNGAPPAGQVPPPLPKRPPRTERGAGTPPPPAPGQQPPPAAAPGGAPVGPDQRRGPAAPPGPGAPPHPGAPQPGPAAAPHRPPQGGAPGQQAPGQQAPGQQAPGQQAPGQQAPGQQAPGQQAPGQQAPGQPPQANQAPPNAAPEQPIQPLHGEPPLTLFRDRRTIMLQPGTDVDRFGEPTGNVLYAARTPYNQRSLPPQWANRNYFAYRVQRPLQVLRGTAVPWFEQPGGGTAYVLPAAVGDLIADGTLVALNGAEAPPRPPME